MIVNKLISLVLGYFFGCIQNAYIAGKVLKGIDIREHGSGNSGATNALRVLGTKVGICVFLADALKGVIAYFISYYIFKDNVTALYAGFGAVMGHNFPAQLGFRGGKGAATTFGVFCAFNWKLALIIFVCGITLLAITKYMSLMSILGSLAFFVGSLIIYGFGEISIIYGVLALILIYRHKANIKRLLKGEERKFSLKSKLNKEKY